MDELTSVNRWVPLTVREPAEDEPDFLVTNNLYERNSYGHMSHAWKVAMVHKHVDGTFAAFLEDDSRIENLTHWASLREFLE